MYIKQICHIPYYYSSSLPTYFAFNFLQWIKWGQNTQSLGVSKCPFYQVKYMLLDELVLSRAVPPRANKITEKGMLSNHSYGYDSLPVTFSIYFYSISNYFRVTLETYSGFLKWWVRYWYFYLDSDFYVYFINSKHLNFCAFTLYPSVK